jgi:hypothetical protein
MLLLLFKKCILFILILLVHILISCLFMHIMTQISPCIFLSLKANAWVKPAKSVHCQKSSIYYVSMYCSAIDIKVHFILDIYFLRYMALNAGEVAELESGHTVQFVRVRPRQDAVSALLPAPRMAGSTMVDYERPAIRKTDS